MPSMKIRKATYRQELDQPKFGTSDCGGSSREFTLSLEKIERRCCPAVRGLMIEPVTNLAVGIVPSATSCKDLYLPVA